MRRPILWLWLVVAAASPAAAKPTYLFSPPSRASMRGMTERLRRGSSLSSVAREGGVTALSHRTPRANLISILRDGVLSPGSAAKGEAKAKNGTAYRALGGYGFNRVFLQATGVRSAGAPVFPYSAKDEKRLGLHGGFFDQVELQFSLDLLDHPANKLSHLNLGWQYGEKSADSIAPRDAAAMARFIHKAAYGSTNELVFNGPVSLKYLTAILVPPDELVAVSAMLRREGIVVPPGVELRGTNRYDGDRKKALRWLADRPTKETRYSDGTLIVEDL